MLVVSDGTRAHHLLSVVGSGLSALASPSPFTGLLGDGAHGVRGVAVIHAPGLIPGVVAPRPGVNAPGVRRWACCSPLGTSRACSPSGPLACPPPGSRTDSSVARAADGAARAAFSSPGVSGRGTIPEAAWARLSCRGRFPPRVSPSLLPPAAPLFLPPPASACGWCWKTVVPSFPLASVWVWAAVAAALHAARAASASSEAPEIRFRLWRLLGARAACPPPRLSLEGGGWLCTPSYVVTTHVVSLLLRSTCFRTLQPCAVHL
mmetsp:Transcript_6946/g.19669  ORF Transcript_6946/g.19669 Transcript_6946/m.19669 type:complete len:263 (+) Transcript_6946:1147-1935(+)